MFDSYLEKALNNPTTRRQALALLSLTAMIASRKTPASAAESGRTPSSIPAPVNSPTQDDSPLDEALGLLQRTEPLAKGGMSTHAPMAAEALCALGAADHVMTWVEKYGAPPLRIPVVVNPIRRDDWRSQLGPLLGTRTWEEANPRWADWREFFL